MASDSLTSFPVVVEQAVAWGDMDAYRHVNNVIYFRYFENARLEYFRRLDWFVYEKETGVSPILASTQCRFRRPLSYPDTIRIGARTVAVDTDRFTIDYRIVSEQLGTMVADGQAVVVTYDHGAGKKVAIPDELRRRIAELEASAAGNV
jgi:acyl-CoA thioester hydrolase